MAGAACATTLAWCEWNRSPADTASGSPLPLRIAKPCPWKPPLRPRSRTGFKHLRGCSAHPAQPSTLNGVFRPFPQFRLPMELLQPVQKMAARLISHVEEAHADQARPVAPDHFTLGFDPIRINTGHLKAHSH